MASLKAIRTRIASVKSTQKITRAMKLVSAARLRRAQDAIVAARPYANALTAAIAEIAARAGEDAHPLMESRQPDRVALIAVTSDRGLAGGFNANVFRRVVRFHGENPHRHRDCRCSWSGKKGRDFFRRRKSTIRQEFPGAPGDTVASRAKELARTVVQTFEDGKVDAVYLIYNEFKSAIVQRIVAEKLLPVAPPAARPAATDGSGADRFSLRAGSRPAAVDAGAALHRVADLSRPAGVGGVGVRRPHDRDGQRDHQRARHDCVATPCSTTAPGRPPSPRS
jgi:F-type H+-transporting ATPase subunit gamma